MAATEVCEGESSDLVAALQTSAANRTAIARSSEGDPAVERKDACRKRWKRRGNDDRLRRRCWTQENRDRKRWATNDRTWEE